MIRELEDAIDRLENSLCGAGLTPHLRREIDIFVNRATNLLIQQATVSEAESTRAEAVWNQCVNPAMN